MTRAFKGSRLVHCHILVRSAGERDLFVVVVSGDTAVSPETKTFETLSNCSGRGGLNFGSDSV